MALLAELDWAWAIYTTGGNQCKVGNIVFRREKREVPILVTGDILS